MGRGCIPRMPWRGRQPEVSPESAELQARSWEEATAPGPRAARLLAARQLGAPLNMPGKASPSVGGGGEMGGEGAVRIGLNKREGDGGERMQLG